MKLTYLRGSAFIPHLKEGVFPLCLRAPRDKRYVYPPVETKERIQNLINNGVFKDLQNFVDTAVIQFLNSFDHAKINSKQTQTSLCKFRVFTESMDDLLNFLQKRGIQGHFDTILVDYRKIDHGDFLMHHVNRGHTLMVFEVDIYEQNSKLKDGKEYIFD